ncbi:hypothetical protein OUZ56_028206 [Daphnia magna]|uniref:Uncharacterized protein n=1 Tax=Daphnia magna TaxID=35525 RepID=A0ABR0B367_9CRUS|nr:hypothetical protein OUZ56_028206 [Daphnia magna]
MDGDNHNRVLFSSCNDFSVRIEIDSRSFSNKTEIGSFSVHVYTLFENNETHLLDPYVPTSNSLDINKSIVFRVAYFKHKSRLLGDIF